MTMPGPDLRSVRPSAIIQEVPEVVRVAGAFYPDSPGELADTVDELLAQAAYHAADDELLAIISPHAGYAYSGQTAAYAYRQLENRHYDLVIVLGPSHYDDFGAVAVSAKRYYATPLGAVELAADVVTELSRHVPLTPVEYDREHSLEVQLPFLQRMLGDFKLVPLMMRAAFYDLGEDPLPLCTELAQALAELVRSRSERILFVASSDLSHIRDYEAVLRFDARTAELVEAFDIDALVDYMRQGGRPPATPRACGDGPIVTALLASKALGATYARVFHRTNSGDVTGVRRPGQYTVGYMAAGVYRGS